MPEACKITHKSN